MSRDFASLLKQILQIGHNKCAMEQSQVLDWRGEWNNVISTELN